MAAPAAEATGGETSGDGNAEAGRRQGKPRKGSKGEAGETIDELAMETKRTTLLDRLEGQLKGGRQHVSRLLFGFSVADDKKIQKGIDQEFSNWRQQQEGGAEALSGVLVFASAVGLHLLEGPTELLFKALEFFHSISAEAKKLPQDSDGGVQATPRPNEKGELPAMLSKLHILHFTELHGVRVARSWAQISHPGKVIGGTQTQMEDSNSHELVFAAYKKMMCLCLKVSKMVAPDDPEDSQEVSTSDLQKAYKKAADELPSVDEILIILGKTAFEFFLSVGWLLIMYVTKSSTSIL